MNGAEFIRRMRKVGRRTGVPVRFDPRPGKGSHGRLYYGERYTTLMDRKKEISRPLLHRMCRQLGITPAALHESLEVVRTKSTRAEPSDEAFRAMTTQLFAYPVELSHEEGTVVVSFHDIPEALTEGADEAEALNEAADCLIAALGGYIELRRDIPAPSHPRRGQPVVTVPPLVAAKLALYRAMRGSGLTRVALGKRLGISEGAVRRLLDLDHRSHIGQVEAALAVLGKRLVVEVRDTAA